MNQPDKTDKNYLRLQKIKSVMDTFAKFYVVLLNICL